MEADLKLIYQHCGIEDLKLSLNTIEVDIIAEQKFLEECTDELYREDVKQTIKDLNHEAAYVAGLIKLYYETQQN